MHEKVNGKGQFHTNTFIASTKKLNITISIYKLQ